MIPLDKRETFKKRILRKVRKEKEGCWYWEGATNGGGYPVISANIYGQSNMAHRIAWEVFRGTDPAGKLVLKTCNKRRCLNPNHLYLGTDQEKNQRTGGGLRQCL